MPGVPGCQWTVPEVQGALELTSPKGEPVMRTVTARRNIENALLRFGFVAVAGVDEVGRGCLAGPVMAGAVILNASRPIAGLRDSKLLTAGARDRLYDEIRI